MSWETPLTTTADAATDGWGTATQTNRDNTAAIDAWGSVADTDGEAKRDENGVNAAADETPELTEEELIKRVRDKGWTNRTAFDYELFNQAAGDGDWAGLAQRYEYKEEYGDVLPRHQELETVLFGGEFQMRRGEHIDALQLDVAVDGSEQIAPVRKFEDAGLHPVVMENINLARYDQPTPIQAYTIPAILGGKDVLAVAQTGSGKTAAYLIPIVSKLMGKAKKLAAAKPDRTAPGYDPRQHKVRAEPLVVIVVPTRELAIQIFDEARRLCYRSMLRPCVAYGGLPQGLTLDELGAGCDILIATPGRLCDLMDKPRVLTLSRVKYTVIDEADEMLDTDWSEDLTKIMAGGDTNEDADHVYIMTSATFPKSLRKLANDYLAEDHARIRVGQTASAHRNITQEVIWVEGDQKMKACEDLLLNMSPPARTMIFCNSKPAVDRLDDYLYNRGLPTTSIHGDRNQREREDAMRAFRTGRAPILIATGVSARGWDIKDCKYVINYDMPSSMYGGITEYIHRIGRTARIGNKGMATSFYNDRDEEIGPDLVKVLVHCGQTVPEFLESHKPEEGQEVDFQDNSDDEDEPAADGFGAATTNEAGDAEMANGWGAPAERVDSGFTPTGDAPVVEAGW